jgi:hypothetical protein
MVGGTIVSLLMAGGYADISYATSVWCSPP